MQRATEPTLNRRLDRALLAAFGDHVIELSRKRLPPAAPAGYFWLDRPQAARRYATYREFLLGEFGGWETFQAHYPAFDVGAARACLSRAQATPDRLLVLTDVAPKNIVHHAGTFTHLDLEVTLVGPPDFLLVKAAVNLASDIGDRFDARAVRERILACCDSDDDARAALAFALMRRMIFEARGRVSDPRAPAALNQLLSGASLAAAITCLEGTWDATGADDGAARPAQ